MPFTITILGSNSALPANGRHPTAQVINIREHLMLVDCGEGTQIQMVNYGIKSGKIDYVFISHLHGDHFFGLFGLITSFNLNQRTKPLTIFGPKGLEEIIKIQHRYSNTELRYQLNFVEIEPVNGKVILETDVFKVSTLQMKHRIPCCGFLFEEISNERKINKEALEKYRIPVEVLPQLKHGADLTMPDGTVIPNNVVTDPPHKARSYAFCTDTLYQEELCSHVKGVDILYHEATFLSDLQQRALDTFHATAREAALVAQAAQVEKLVLGHFSARYGDLEMLLKEAKPVFANTELAIEGTVFSIERRYAH